VRYDNDDDEYNHANTVATPLQGSALESNAPRCHGCGGHGGNHKLPCTVVHMKRKVTRMEVVIGGLDIGDARHREHASAPNYA
jgi:hypothetical protein